MPGQVSLKEVARIVALSESTVSKALNDRSDVSASVKQRVREAAQQLGYAPNPAARSLAMGKSAAIGVFLLNRFNRPAGEYFGFNFLGGLMKEAQNRGCDLMIFQESEEIDRIGYLEYARKRGVAGAVLIGLWPNDKQLDQLAADPWPWVSIDTPINGACRGVVSTDNRQAMNCALQAVYDKGHRSIGYIGIHGGGYVGLERRSAFINFCAERNLDNSALEIDTALNVASGYEAALKLLSGKRRPQALVCASDLQALGALQAARDLGIKVPEDLAVTGFDNIPAAGLTSPALTTVAQDADAIGRAAIASVLSDVPDGAITLVPAQLVIRDSL